MPKNTNEKLNNFLDHIKEEAYATNNDFVKLSDIKSRPLDDDVSERVNKLIESAKLPNGYVDINALIYDMHGILYCDTVDSKASDGDSIE